MTTVCPYLGMISIDASFFIDLEWFKWFFIRGDLAVGYIFIQIRFNLIYGAIILRSLNTNNSKIHSNV